MCCNWICNSLLTFHVISVHWTVNKANYISKWWIKWIDVNHNETWRTFHHWTAALEMNSSAALLINSTRIILYFSRNYYIETISTFRYILLHIEKLFSCFVFKKNITTKCQFNAEFLMKFIDQANNFRHLINKTCTFCHENVWLIRLTAKTRLPLSFQITYSPLSKFTFVCVCIYNFSADYFLLIEQWWQTHMQTLYSYLLGGYISSTNDVWFW